MEVKVGIEREPIKLMTTKRYDIFVRVNDENKKINTSTLKAENNSMALIL